MNTLQLVSLFLIFLAASGAVYGLISRFVPSETQERLKAIAGGRCRKKAGKHRACAPVS